MGKLPGLMLVLLGGPAMAQDLLVSGRLESVTLIPFGAPTCAPVSGTRTGSDGRQSVVISNACGCEESRLRVERVDQGSGVSVGEVLVLRNDLGEWCRPRLPLDHALVQVRRSADGQHWQLLKGDAPPQAAHHE